MPEVQVHLRVTFGGLGPKQSVNRPLIATYALKILATGA